MTSEEYRNFSAVQEMADKLYQYVDKNNTGCVQDDLVAKHFDAIDNNSITILYGMHSSKDEKISNAFTCFKLVIV